MKYLQTQQNDKIFEKFQKNFKVNELQSKNFIEN